SLARLRPDEDWVEDLAGKHRTNREKHDGDEDRQRAFVRVVTAASARNMVRVVTAVAMLLGGGFMDVLKLMLDVLGRGPARLTEEGQEDEAPAVEAGQQGGERAGPEGDGAR